MMWMRIGVTAVLGLLGSCATVRLEPPQLQVTDVSLVGGDVFRQQLRVRLRVQNPNNVELPVRGITYEVQLAGETFATGASERDFVVPALAASEFDVDITANAAAAVVRLLGSRGDPSYRIHGKVRLARGVVRSIPFDHTGTLRLR